MMNDDDLIKQLKNIASALWSVSDQIEKMRHAVEQVQYTDELYPGRKVYGIRVHDNGRD